MRNFQQAVTISTHAPHARRGDAFEAEKEAHDKISTHAPHARRGLHRRDRYNEPNKFLLTRLMRGAAKRQVYPAFY